ncbi:hypothetical protein NA57DRAFT_54723 [Rhizodiscina lignyota]|uniref:DUF7918 domain-containing protein n=1 Tax=Rhizodiscina lignyota TaxID=1504668 RepID=A0A9P4M835_9PEZI|nr:hypothetical protein NA57DRAFT_54723 [Rhizodiscina lignyota]
MINVEFRIDGKWVDGIGFREGQLGRTGSQNYLPGVMRREKGSWVERALRFSELTTSEDDIRGRQEELRKSIQRIGEISIRVHRCYSVKKVTSPPDDSKLQDVGTIPEKALKGMAVSHKVHLLGTGHRYLFAKHPTEALKAMCIVPRSESPERLEERDIDDLSLEEARELLRRERESNGALKKVKREAKRERIDDDSETTTDDEIRVIHERPAKRTRSSAKDNELPVIDLTL